MRPLPSVTRGRPVLRALYATLFGLTLVPGAAQADEFDWVYFPMYVGDMAHAVDLRSLKVRPDGLLNAASRYPRDDG